MADHDRYPTDDRGYQRDRQWNRADPRDEDFNRDRLDNRTGYGAQGGGYRIERNRDDSFGAGGYGQRSYGRSGEDRSFGASDLPSPRGGTHAYGAGDSARGDRASEGRDVESGYESYDFNPYQGQYGGGSRHESRGRQHADQHRGFTERAFDEVSSWFGDRGAASRRQQDARASHHGKGPKGYRRSDDRIREDVSDRLADDHWLDASDIDLTVENCEVTLSGTVQDRDSRRRAENLVESCSGVSHVQNNLRVKQQDQSASGVDTRTGIGINTKLDDQAAGRA